MSRGKRSSMQVQGVIYSNPFNKNPRRAMPATQINFQRICFQAVRL